MNKTKISVGKTTIVIKRMKLDYFGKATFFFFRGKRLPFISFSIPLMYYLYQLLISRYYLITFKKNKKNGVEK